MQRVDSFQDERDDRRQDGNENDDKRAPVGKGPRIMERAPNKSPDAPARWGRDVVGHHRVR